MNRRLCCLTALLAPITTILLGGCTGLGLTIAPDVTLVNLEFTDLTVFETAGEITLRLSNENADPLVIEGGTFLLYLNDTKIGRGLTSEVMELPALGTSTHRVELFVNNLALATRLVSLLDRPVLAYRIKARLRLRTSYGIRRLTSNYQGSFALEGKENPVALDSAAAVDG